MQVTRYLLESLDEDLAAGKPAKVIVGTVDGNEFTGWIKAIFGNQNEVVMFMSAKEYSSSQFVSLIDPDKVVYLTKMDRIKEDA